MIKKHKDGMYVHLIERKNGKYVKNESYTIDELCAELRNTLRPIKLDRVKLSWLQKLLLGKKKNMLVAYYYEQGVQDAVEGLGATIEYLITNDTEGKK